MLPSYRVRGIESAQFNVAVFVIVPLIAIGITIVIIIIINQPTFSVSRTHFIEELSIHHGGCEPWLCPVFAVWPRRDGFPSLCLCRDDGWG